MKVQIDTKERSVYISANDITKSLEELDQWIAALRHARRWLKKERGETQ